MYKPCKTHHFPIISTNHLFSGIKHSINFQFSFFPLMAFMYIILALTIKKKKISHQFSFISTNRLSDLTYSMHFRIFLISFTDFIFQSKQQRVQNIFHASQCLPVALSFIYALVFPLLKWTLAEIYMITNSI